MKRLLFVLIFLCFLTEASSSNLGIAEVHLAVINNPPVITNIVILPAAYEDTFLDCKVDFEDELKDINLDYNWYRNGVYIYNKSSNLHPSYFKEKDIITCEVIPSDFVQNGDPKNLTVEIKPKPFLSTITGAVSGFSKKPEFFGIFSILILVALVILAVSYFFRKNTMF